MQAVQFVTITELKMPLTRNHAVGDRRRGDSETADEDRPQTRKELKKDRPSPLAFRHQP